MVTIRDREMVGDMQQEGKSKEDQVMVDRLAKLAAAAGTRLAATVSRLAAAGGGDGDGETPKKVAILVIDDFGLKKEHDGQNGEEEGQNGEEEGQNGEEEGQNGEEEGQNGEEEGQNGQGGHCTEAADGQIFAAGGAIFAAGGAASTLVDLEGAIKDPLYHGDLVLMKVFDVLHRADATLLRYSDSGDPFNGWFDVLHRAGATLEAENGPAYGEAWLPHESVWHVRGSDVHVIAVDTEGFNTDVIRQHIVDCICLLKNEGVDRFVLNMSFAIIPCEFMDDNEYVNALNENPELAALEAALQQRDGDEAPDDDRKHSLRRLARTRTFYEPLTENEREFWLKKDNEENEGLDDGESKPNFLQELGDPPDPLLEFFRDPPSYINRETDNEEDIVNKEDIINVAAAGNAGRNFPYAPAIWEQVLSVSAGGAQDQHHRYANDGEVIAYDIVEVKHKDGGTIPVHGSSFAAPEVSVRAALYLAEGRDAACNDNPLAYADENGLWKNMTLTDAQKDLCVAFPVELP